VKVVDVILQGVDLSVMVSLPSMDGIDDPFDDGEGTLHGPLMVPKYIECGVRGEMGGGKGMEVELPINNKQVWAVLRWQNEAGDSITCNGNSDGSQGQGCTGWDNHMG
jgi:hypothetical protein